MPFTASVSFHSSTSNNVLRVAASGSDRVVIQSSPLNQNYVEVLLNGVRSYTGLAATIDSVVIEGTDNPDFIIIDAISGVPNVNVNLRNGDDIVTVHPHPASGQPTILRANEIFGGGGNDTIYIDDSASNTGTAWTVSNPFDVPQPRLRGRWRR